jgi:hypothetical protein
MIETKNWSCSFDNKTIFENFLKFRFDKIISDISEIFDKTKPFRNSQSNFGRWNLSRNQNIRKAQIDQNFFKLLNYYYIFYLFFYICHLISLLIMLVSLLNNIPAKQ